MDDERIKVKSSIPSLQNKIQTKIDKDSDSVYWYIRFNVPLDKSTVSHKTMGVTDTDGYIMRTEIDYMNEKNTIVIMPLDTYEQDIFYLLNISRKVKSASGKKMRSQIHILFKLMGGQISEFKILKSNVEVPGPKPRPRNYDKMVQEKIRTRSRVYSFDEKIFEKVEPHKLPMAEVKVNILLGVLGLVILIVFLFMRYIMLLYVGLIVSLVGGIHIALQMSRKNVRSVILYNMGVWRFNKEKYLKAEEYFRKALVLDENNELAEFAINKIAFYK